jgi:hypothetical protein
VVGQTTSVRLLTGVEAAAGLGVLTATLGYLPAIYTLVSELRTANQAVADLGAGTAEGAAGLLAFATDEGHPLERHQRAFKMALQRLVEDLTKHGGEPRTGMLDPDAASLFDEARAASPHGEAAATRTVSEESMALAGRLHAVLDAYARRHGYPWASISTP